jgi:hypothetical protein
MVASSKASTKPTTGTAVDLGLGLHDTIDISKKTAGIYFRNFIVLNYVINAKGNNRTVKGEISLTNIPIFG